MSETYGVYYFGRNWGGLKIGGALTTLIWQNVYGHFYDRNIVQSEGDFSLYCFGSSCFMVILIILLGNMLLGLVCDFVLLKRSYKRYREHDALVKSFRERNYIDCPIPSQGNSDV